MKTTRKQIIALFIVGQHGPITPAELARHTVWTTPEAERSRLARLEARCLVAAHYTSGGAARAFTLTDRGRAVLDHAEKED